jgi:hypothetical protein
VSEEPVPQVYTSGTPFELSETETTVPRDNRVSVSESPAPESPSTEASASERTDPELSWLESPEARQYAGHWVALSPETGEFLGMADSDVDFRRWQLRGATVVFVEPPGFQAGA